MTRRWVLAGLVVAAAWLPVGSARAADAKDYRRGMALARLSLVDAIQLVEAQTRGRVYEAQMKVDDDEVVYEVKYIIGDEKRKSEINALVAPLSPAGSPPTAYVPVVPPTDEAAERARRDRERAEREAAQAREQAEQAAREADRARRDAQRAAEEARRARQAEERMREAAEPPNPPVTEPIEPRSIPETVPPVEPDRSEAAVVAPVAPAQVPTVPPIVEVEGPVTAIRFSDDRLEALPTGFTAVQTSGAGPSATWKVVADPTAPSKPNVVAVTENPSQGSTFNLLVASRPEAKDLEASVRVKALGGQEDRGGGLVWRYQDDGNYYVASWDAAAGEVNVWRVKDGRRKRLASAPVNARADEWHEIRAVMEGDRITAYFDGRQIASERDFTFSDPGRVGVWVKGDARTAFDDLTVTALGERR